MTQYQESITSKDDPTRTNWGRLFKDRVTIEDPDIQIKNHGDMLVRRLQRFRCECEESELRVMSCRGGSKQYRPQCLQCGRSAGQPIKKPAYHKHLKGFDVDLINAWEDGNSAAIKEYQDFLRVNPTRYHVICSWHELYDQYLDSDEWKSKRELILIRDDYSCQSCDQPAQAVHHKNYHSVGDEDLECLISICFPCHENIHFPKGAH